MRIRLAMIDKSIRLSAIGAWLLLWPSEWYFRIYRLFSRGRVGCDIAGLDCDEVYIPRTIEPSHIRTRIYKPHNAGRPLPILLYIHGGGYFSGAPEAFSRTIRQFMDTRDCVIVAPDYRKSLDAPYPAAIDDCFDVLCWIKDNAVQLGGRTDQIMVAGHSAGGGLTAAVSLRARDRGSVNICFQMPIYPMIDDRADTESARRNNAPLWNSKLNALAWSLYLGPLKNRQETIPADAAPARAIDFRGLPPTLTYVGDLEPFRDETITYVNRLKEAGVPVEFRLFKGCYHGFDLINPGAAISRQAIEFSMQGFATAVDTLFRSQAPVNRAPESS